MAHSCGEALGSEQEMLNDQSTCVTFGLHHYYADTLDCLVYFSVLPFLEAHVRYELVLSLSHPVYNMIWFWFVLSREIGRAHV